MEWNEESYLDLGVHVGYPSRGIGSPDGLLLEYRHCILPNQALRHHGFSSENSRYQMDFHV